MVKRKKADWRHVPIPLEEGEGMLRVDLNSRRIAVCFNRETGRAKGTDGCEGLLLKPDGSEQAVFVGIEILETLGLA